MNSTLETLQEIADLVRDRHPTDHAAVSATVHLHRASRCFCSGRNNPVETARYNNNLQNGLTALRDAVHGLADRATRKRA